MTEGQEQEGSLSWDKLCPKHIFVLSSAGKPIFTRSGDEQQLVTTFGLIQAVISIVQDQDGDYVQCIQAGSRRIVYFIKESLYFVAVSSTGEPEAVLRQQLTFIYYQIIFVLTSKVHDILKSNPSKDLRDLLGTDTKRLMHASCTDELAYPPIVFNSVKGFALDGNARAMLLGMLRQCLNQSNAVLGCIICEDSLLVHAINETMDVSLDVKDLLLLSHFVHHSPSLRCHDQNNWVPLCLPCINEGGYVQAYISPLKLDENSNGGASSPQKNQNDPSPVSLILISASSGSSDEIKKLHDARMAIQQGIWSSSIASHLVTAIANQNSICDNLLSTVNAVHFFYKYKPSADTPAQCLWSKRSESAAALGMTTALERKIWLNCFRLALCLRTGSSMPECTLLTPEDPTKLASSGSTNSSSSKSNAAGAEGSGSSRGRRKQYNAFCDAPSADHAHSYVVLDSGEVCIGVATSYSELYVTFPNTIDSSEAYGLSNLMTRFLRKDAESLFFSSQEQMRA